MFKALEWDSSFFGFNVVRVDANIDNENDWELLCSQLLANDIKLAYYTSEQLLSCGENTSYKAYLADRKLTFYKKANANAGVPDTHIQPYTAPEPTGELIRLAIESGVYSRFNIDKHFEPGKFESLYELWIRKSVDKSIAREVLVYNVNQQIAGFVTLGEKQGRGDIGIIAVDENFRGQGIGRKLMLAAEDWFLKNNFSELQVVTQGDNAPACRLYESCGYERESMLYFYHLWQSL